LPAYGSGYDNIPKPSNNLGDSGGEVIQATMSTSREPEGQLIGGSSGRKYSGGGSGQKKSDRGVDGAGAAGGGYSPGKRTVNNSGYDQYLTSPGGGEYYRGAESQFSAEPRRGNDICNARNGAGNDPQADKQCKHVNERRLNIDENGRSHNSPHVVGGGAADSAGEGGLNSGEKGRRAL